MADNCGIKAAVKLTFTEMSCLQIRCRCCYSVDTLEMLCGHQLYVYKLISNSQGMECENIPIAACLPCREFLNEVYCFRIKCNAVNEMMCNNLDVKPLEVELVLRKSIEENSSNIDIKVEVIDEKDETDHVDIEINKVEVSSDLEYSQKVSESLSVSYLANGNNQLHNWVDHDEESDMRQNSSEHFVDRVFSCDLCSFSTPFKVLADRHTFMHMNKQLYVCDHCNYQATTRGNLIEHIRRHLNKHKPFKCSQCSYKTKTQVDLKKHTMRKHSGEKPFSCDQCDYCGKMKTDLIIHKRIHLNDFDNPFKCSECSYKTKTRTQLKMHIVCKHSEEKPFFCDQCNYCAKTQRNLTIHKRSHLNDDGNALKCNLCSYKATTMFKLKCHTVRRHNDDKPFSCDQCDYCVKTNRDLTIHKRSHLNDFDNPFKCSQCSYKTTTMRKLKNHAAHKHSDEKPFRCDECAYCAKTKINLTIHKRKHLDGADNPFKCSECSFKTTTMSQLKGHTKRKHNVEKS